VATKSTLAMKPALAIRACTRESIVSMVQWSSEVEASLPGTVNSAQ
jgi:hypothetical protein